MKSSHPSVGSRAKRRIQPYRRSHYRKTREQLLLDGLNDHVLTIIVDYLFDMDELDDECCACYSDSGLYFQTHRSTLNLSVVNKRLRAICIPKLFRKIHRHSKTMGQLNRQLKDIELDLQILASIRTCEIVTSSRGESTLCRTRLPVTLEAMPFLKELSITHRKAVDFSGTEQMFDVYNINLPTVTGLRIQCGGDWYFLIAACPNTEVLVLGDNLECDNTMFIASNLEKLRHVELYKRTWEIDHVELLNEYLPKIESLTLKGGVEGQNFVEWAKMFAGFTNLRSLAMPLEQSVEESRFVHAFSDDSLIAESIIRASKENGTDIDQRPLAWSFFEECHVLETLWFWEVASAPWPWTAVRDVGGKVESVSCDYYEDDFDWDRMSGHYETLDRDAFPLVLSFPREITSCHERWDPPRYGRTPDDERQDRDAWDADSGWYATRWLKLWRSVNAE